MRRQDEAKKSVILDFIDEYYNEYNEIPAVRTIAVALSQNYMLEVSGDGVNWQTVINYRDISTLNASTGTNDGVTCILVGAYANIDSTLYIRLSNANAKTNGSWGGAISSFTFQYLVSDASEELTIADLKSTK